MAGDFSCTCWKRNNFFALGVAANYFVLNHGYEVATYGALSAAEHHETGYSGGKDAGSELKQLIVSVVEGFDEAKGGRRGQTAKGERIFC